MSESKYVLTLTTEQLLTVSKACEFYSRVMMGQFGEIAYETMLQSIKQDDFCTRREMMEDLLFQARKFAFPDLNGRGHSYGIGHNQSADRAWNTYQALRYARAWHEHPEGGITVDFNKPYPAGGESIPDCRLLTDDSDVVVWKKKAEAAIADLREVVKQTDDGCKLCIHNHVCLEEKCPKFECGVGAVGKDGTEFPDFKWSCTDFDWGTCSMLENTPCNGCDFQNHWEWRGPQEGEQPCRTSANTASTNPAEKQSQT